uniref:VTT domain-containing protein n=1 Tax=Picea sitchensis TaxID=3332 RepID=D5A8I9_PICSI|nr:unknown [Picea sitchensis]
MAVTWCSVLRVVILLLLSGVIAIAFFTLPFEKILKTFLVWIDTNLGHWGPLVLALAYIPLTVLAVPASILTLGGGYLFGLPVGFVADSVGSTAGATAAFLLGKMVGRTYVVSKLKNYPKFEAVAIAIQRSGFKITLLLRLAPLLPFTILNYLLSLTPISIGEYILASWLGMVPITLALVYVGTTIKDLSDVTHGWKDISLAHWILLTVGFVSTVVLMVLVDRVARKSLNDAIKDNDGKVDIICTLTDSALANEPCLDLQQPLIVKVEPIVNSYDN